MENRVHRHFSLVSHEGVQSTVQAIRDDVLERLQDGAILEASRAIYDEIMQRLRAELPGIVQAAVAEAVARIERPAPVAPNVNVTVTPQLQATLSMPKRKTTSQRSILYDERSGLPATIIEQKTEQDE